MRSISDVRRANGELPTNDTRCINGEREENVGVSDIAVIKIILGARLERIRVHGPSAHRNGHSKLRFLVPLTAQGNKAEILAIHEVHDGAGGGQQRRRLIKLSVERPEYPIEARHARSYAKPRIRRVFHHVSGKMCLANACIQGQPGCCAKLLFGKQCQ